MKAIVSAVTSKGQVTIPAEIRRTLGIERGDKLAFLLDDQGRVELRPAAYSTVASVRGAAGSLREPLSWQEVREIAREDHLMRATLPEHG